LSADATWWAAHFRRAPTGWVADWLDWLLPRGDGTQHNTIAV
jgi:hypothetical protein